MTTTLRSLTIIIFLALIFSSTSAKEGKSKYYLVKTNIDKDNVNEITRSEEKMGRNVNKNVDDKSDEDRD